MEPLTAMKNLYYQGYVTVTFSSFSLSASYITCIFLCCPWCPDNSIAGCRFTEKIAAMIFFFLSRKGVKSSKLSTYVLFLIYINSLFNLCALCLLLCGENHISCKWHESWSLSPQPAASCINMRIVGYSEQSCKAFLSRIWNMQFREGESATSAAFTKRSFSAWSVSVISHKVCCISFGIELVNRKNIFFLHFKKVCVFVYVKLTSIMIGCYGCLSELCYVVAEWFLAFCQVVCYGVAQWWLFWTDFNTFLYFCSGVRVFWAGCYLCFEWKLLI